MAVGLILKKTKFKTEILEKDFEGNQARCAKALGISASYLCNVLKHPRKKQGTALFLGIIIYCEKTKRNAMDFMRLPVTKRQKKPAPPLFNNSIQQKNEICQNI